MADIEMTDRTGQLPTLKDVEQAKQAVMVAITKIGDLPPMLGIEMPNILRCLGVAEHVIRRVEEAKSGS